MSARTSGTSFRILSSPRRFLLPITRRCSRRVKEDKLLAKPPRPKESRRTDSLFALPTLRLSEKRSSAPNFLTLSPQERAVADTPGVMLLPWIPRRCQHRSFHRSRQKKTGLLGSQSARIRTKMILLRYPRAVVDPCDRPRRSPDLPSQLNQCWRSASWQSIHIFSKSGLQAVSSH